MAKYRIESSGYIQIKDNNKNVKLLKKPIFDDFNEDILGLGRIDTKSVALHALSVIFDLEGFTTFCKQID